ncbi:retroviral-like aspartic protease family protein [Massilia pinisoli]|uniref:Retroviral-like aspartic protease family protein n=1 Tax=Massilia pinisoli TaxID=1772194 RepID=A0ABT1ZUA0_9BURK|nr:aspartyl protease family protein [Massilia pinisoli]MCS0583505.1 retroviral-like aspartic protease family protein [Massilia pinisoli]
MIHRLAPLLFCLMSGLAHAAGVASECTYTDVGSLPLRYVGESLVPAVAGSINGLPSVMLVDTGSSQTSLTMNGATRRDLPLFLTGVWVEGIGGGALLYRTRVKEFSLGPAHNNDRTELTVIGSTSFTPAFDAILGAPFLLQMDLEFDLRNKRMTFFRAHDCSKTALLLWQEPTIMLPFDRSDDPSPNPHFTVVVNGKEMDAVIDSGAHRSVMTLKAAKRAGIDVNGPGAVRLGDVGGIGTTRAPHWIAPVRKVQFGDETIQNVEIGVIDPQGANDFDLLLGQDFLRAHRVLFAMSQEKLYIAYLGGDVFTRGTGLEPWMRAEADHGNPDAQYALAMMYEDGDGVTADLEQARAWLDKAAAGGQPNAGMLLGRQQMLDGHLDTAIAQLRGALDQLPADRIGPLWLYLARVRHGEAALAQTELAAARKRQREDGWPVPIAEFYLGRIGAARLLEEARKDEKRAHDRTCMAQSYMAEWYEARGDKAEAATLQAAVQANCRAAAP